jgi:hypothetical protein
VTTAVRAGLAAALALAGAPFVVAPVASADPVAPTRLIVTYATRADRAVHETAAALPDDGSRVVRSFAHLPVVAIEATPAARQRLEASPDVVSVAADRWFGLADDGATTLAPAADPPPMATGTGWTVAVLDTGADLTHPYIAGRTGPGVDALGDGGACFASDCPFGTTGPASAQPCTVSGCDHGTHVAGIAVGDATKVSNTGLGGMAPGAGLYPVRVFSTTSDPAACGSGRPCASAQESDVLAALDHILTEAPHYRFAAVNLSLGDNSLYPSTCSGASPDQAAMVTAIGAIRDAGIAVVVAAGNHHSATGISFPACAEDAIAVAALNASSAAIAEFSDASPKIALAAPGTSVLSSLPGNTFGLKSGTSMAAPAVAGAFALLRQAAPDASLASLLDLLRATGRAAPDPRTGATYPALDVDAALRTLGYTGPHSSENLTTGFAGLPTPQRLVDTRVGAGRLAAGATLAITMPARPAGLGTSPAASLNVTAVGASAPGFLTVYPCGGGTPLVSSVNYTTSTPVANKVVVTVPADGRVCFFTMSATDVVIDLDGWLVAEHPFHAVDPHRVLDTRQMSAPLTDVAVAVAPPGAVGTAVNVTVTEPAAAGFATIYPCGSALPLASNLNFVAGATVPAAALVPVDGEGRICIHTSAPAHVVVDVAGWLQAGFNPVVPFRAVDTRSLGPPVTDVVVSPGNLAGARGVALTLTITEPTAAGYATVYPCGQVPPLVSNVNFVAGQTVANAVVATPDTQGRVCVHTLVPTHVVVDVSGMFV